MSKLTDQVTAQANANAAQVYINQIEALEAAIIKDREVIRKFLEDGACNDCIAQLQVTDKGNAFIPTKASET